MTTATGSFLLRLERTLFWATAIAASFLHWIPHFPPQIDLAQHAAQMRLLHDWTQPDFKLREILELNFFTPYLPAYLLGAALTFVMPALAAVKLVWSLGALGTVYATARIRARLGGNGDWDWLVLPGLFGTTFQWGFLTFFFAVPLGLFFLECWLVYISTPSVRRGVLLGLALIVLFFAHALVTAWVLLVCALMLLTPWSGRLDELKRLVKTGLPLVTPIPVVIMWYIATRRLEQASKPYHWELGAHRIVDFLAQWLGDPGGRVSMIVGSALLAAPFVAGARFDDNAIRRTPMLLTLLILLAAPFYVFGNAFTYNRFFTLLGPVIVIALAGGGSAQGRLSAVRYVLPAMAIAWTLLTAAKMRTFADEQQDFIRLIAPMESGRHVVGIVRNAHSPALADPDSYTHFPVWYQVEKGGLVEFNFAAFYPTIVRFGADYRSAISQKFSLSPKLNLSENRQIRIEYLIVRPAVGDGAPVVGEDTTKLVRIAGAWRLYARTVR